MLLACAAALLVCAPAALAAGGVSVKPKAPAPENARTLGPLCRVDTPAFRLWWSDTPGAPGAADGSDGACATLPPVVSELAATAEAARASAAALGFGPMRGDAGPVFAKRPALTRSLLRMSARARAGTFARTPRVTRGQYLASLSTAQRARVLRRLPKKLRSRLLADTARAQRGRPSDFVGGDGRVDIVIDSSGATGQVQDLQTGLSPCRITTNRGKSAFVASWAVVLARPGVIPRAVLAHELFHVVQCNLRVGFNSPTLLREGTAEWFASIAQPADFASAVTATPSGGTTASGGNARVISFCNGFDPSGSGTTPYVSWPIWQALDPGTPTPGAVRGALGFFTGSTGVQHPATAVIGRIGVARWTEAVRVATQAVCGTLRSPTGAIAFDPAVRGFFGALRPAIVAGAPGSMTVPPGGVSSVVAAWGRRAVASVSVRLSSAQVPPETLIGFVASTATTGSIAPVVRDGAVVFDIPAAALVDGYVPLTVANTSDAATLAVQVEVAAS